MPRPPSTCCTPQYEGRAQGYTYAREGHPNATLLASKIDMLEGAEGGIVTGSGMAAVTAAIMGLLGAGDHIIGPTSSMAAPSG